MPHKLPDVPDLATLPTESRAALNALVQSAITYRGAFFKTIEGTVPLTIVREKSRIFIWPTG